MKIRLPLLFAIAVLAFLQAGCANLSESPYLTPGAIRSSFANVQVQIAHKTLRVVLQSSGQDLRDLGFVRGTTSSYTTLKPLTLTGTVYSPQMPNQIEFDFAPAPSPPFNIDLYTTLQGQPLTLRADYYGPRGISF